MKNHIKRIASPRSWVIDRMKNVFIVRPKPGGHPLQMGLALGVVLRDFAQVTSTLSEAKKILNQGDVLVDCKVRKSHRFIVGLFDTLSLPKLKKYFRMILDKKGKLILKEISKEESVTKAAKIIGKNLIKKGKVQCRLHDGKSIIFDKEVKVGDTFILNLLKLDVKEILHLKTGSEVFLIGGKYAGHLGKLKEIKLKEAILEVDGKDVETAKRYLFVTGGNVKI